MEDIDKIEFVFRLIGAKKSEEETFSKNFSDKAFDFAVRKNKRNQTVLTVNVSTSARLQTVNRTLGRLKIQGKRCHFIVSIYSSIDNGIVDVPKKHMDFIRKFNAGVFVNYTVRPDL